MAKISYKQSARLFRRLATSYSAGIDIRTIYTREANSGSPTYKLNAQRTLDGINEGLSLANAMRRTNGYFPELAISVIKAGEQGGRLEDSFERLSEHYNSIVKFRSAFLLSIAWPTFELLFSVLVIGLLILIMGWVCDTANIEPIDWLGFGFSTTQYFVLYWLVMFFIFGSLATIIIGVAKGWFGTLPMKIARRIPLIGKTIESMSLSRFAWTMSIAENAGMNPFETVQLATRSTQNYYYQRLEAEMCENVRKGKSFYRSMLATDSFPHF
ncbi:MAG: hypothetical protein GY763_11825, partial [Gammaproteobacteria bacterium]|nr:hypothetical protein [Gammaproteobacteria bacterium]